MNLVCPRCRARLSVSMDRVPPEGRRGKCNRCGEAFLVKPPRPREPQEEEDVYAGPDPEDFHDFPLASAPDAATSSAAPAWAPAPAPGPPDTGRAGPPSMEAVLMAEPPASREAPPPPPIPAARPGPPPPKPSSVPTDPDPLSNTVHLPAGTLTVAPAPTSRGYRLRDARGDETSLDRRDIIRMIRDGSLGPGAFLSEGTGPFKTAGEFEDLRRYFHLRQAPVASPSVGRSSGPLLGCTNHPSEHAAWCCGMCGSYWCAACAAPKPVSNTYITPCAHCAEPCMPVVAAVEVVPFWREIGSLLAYPVKGWGAFMWLMYAGMYWISGYAFIGGLLIYFFLVTYSMLIVKDSAEGGRKVPDWPDFSMWWEVVARGFRGFLCSVIAFLPLIAFGIFVYKAFGEGLQTREGLFAAGAVLLIGGLPLLLFTFIYYPMVFLIASVFDTIVPALNPILIFKAIARVPFDYTIALIFIGVLAVTGLVMSIPFRLVPIPFIGSLFAAIISTYFQFVWLHVLGRMGHQCEARLNWTT